jgi:hypothetical protein
VLNEQLALMGLNVEVPTCTTGHGTRFLNPQAVDAGW